MKEGRKFCLSRMPGLQKVSGIQKSMVETVYEGRNNQNDEKNQ
jgi:hypothetical protein